jgi:hypothetical protein
MPTTYRGLSILVPCSRPSRFGGYSAAATAGSYEADIRELAYVDDEGLWHPLLQVLVPLSLGFVAQRISPLGGKPFIRNGSHLAHTHSRSVAAGWTDGRLSPCLGQLGTTAALTMTEASTTVPRSDWADKPLRNTLATPVRSVGRTQSRTCRPATERIRLMKICLTFIWTKSCACVNL